MNNCKNFRQRTRTKNKRRTVYLYCTELRKEITFDDCRGCEYKEYKSNSSQIKKPLQNNCRQLQKTTKMKVKSNKLAKLEKERQSLFTDDLDHCIICSKSPVNIHEIFGGRNRQKSMKYKLTVPLCTAEHHNQIECKGIHFDKKLSDEWHVKGQTKFEEVYSDLEFVDIFGKNYK